MIAEMDKRFRTTMAILGKETTSYALISPRIAHTMTNTEQIILIIFNLFFSSITNESRFIKYKITNTRRQSQRTSQKGVL